MPEFLDLVTPQEALSTLMSALPKAPEPRAERINAIEALGRVLARPLFAEEALPAFNRSTVDGYAVRAEDTFGAGDGLPAYLRLAGEVQMGTEPDLNLEEGHAAIVHTGGMIPAGADAVVMIEDTQLVSPQEIEVLRSAAVGQNIIPKGEDVRVGECIMEAGTRLRAQEIGGLMALGISTVEVARKPRVGIISTGDEVIPPKNRPNPGQVRDVNSFSLSALVEREGGSPIRYGIIRDDLAELRSAAQRALEKDDLILITAGSSVSARDMTAEIIRDLGPPGVLVHGVSVRPGKPTILGLAGSVPVLGLPGNPMSAFLIADLFVIPLIRRHLGMRGPRLLASIQARMAINVASKSGREDYLPVRLEVSEEGWIAQPVFGRSNLIFTLVQADGLVRIPPPATGLASGERVEVRLLE